MRFSQPVIPSSFSSISSTIFLHSLVSPVSNTMPAISQRSTRPASASGVRSVSSFEDPSCRKLRRASGPADTQFAALIIKLASRFRFSFSQNVEMKLLYNSTRAPLVASLACQPAIPRQLSKWSVSSCHRLVTGPAQCTSQTGARARSRQAHAPWGRAGLLRGSEWCSINKGYNAAGRRANALGLVECAALVKGRVQLRRHRPLDGLEGL